jgi:hypothetical protein
MYIEKDGDIIFFDGSTMKDMDQKSTFIERCWFIAQRMKYRTIEQLKLYANLWIQKKMLGVTYSDDIEKQLHQVLHS